MGNHTLNLVELICTSARTAGRILVSQEAHHSESGGAETNRRAAGSYSDKWWRIRELCCAYIIIGVSWCSYRAEEP